MHDLRALVVDDSKVARLTMMKKLEAIGVKVDLAESGHQALDYLAQKQPDLIFMDQMMPDMDGFEATRRIKAMTDRPNLPPIIALTAHAMGKDREKCLQAGMDDYLSKPIGRDELYHVLIRHLAGKGQIPHRQRPADQE